MSFSSFGFLAKRAAAAARFHGANVAVPSVDLAGNPRKVGKTVDIGCYECQKTVGFQLIVK